MERSSDRGYQEGARTRKARLWLVLIPAVIVATGAFALFAQASEWMEIGREQTMNISGLARMAPKDGARAFLVVHDNKLPGEARLGVLTLGEPARYSMMPWPAGYALPVDLEAVSPVPGQPGLFLALTSGGTALLLEIAGDRVDLRGAFTLPDRPGLPNFEGLSVQRLGRRLVAVWGHRGAGKEAGRLFWGPLDLGTPAITAAQAADLRVPFPGEDDPDTRHISDLRLTRDGRLWISAASDPGNEGPFTSAIYEAGRFHVVDGGIRFEPHTTLRPAQTYSRKIEAIELTENESALVLGTDDESAGGAVASLMLSH